jgi:protein ImuB
MTLSVNAARAMRDPAHIAELFRQRSERLEGEYDAGFGIDMIRLAASSVAAVASHQLGAFDSADGAEDLDRLYDRMGSRLGPQAVRHSRFVDTHVPEAAVVLEPVLARTPADPQAAPDPERLRPVRLLPEPEPVQVLAEVPHGPPMRMVWRRVSYRIVRTAGPERIEAEWWRRRQNLKFLTPPQPEAAEPPPPDRSKKKVGVPAPVPHVSRLDTFDPETTLRDYYVVEDDGGRRFWVFRLGLYGASAAPRWYLHGFFA